MKRIWQDLHVPLLAAALWTLFAMLTVGAHDLAGSVVLIWIPSGVTVAAFQITRRRRWPLLAMVLFPVELAARCAVGASFLEAFVFSSASLVQAMVCVMIVTRILGSITAMPRTAQHIAGIFCATLLASAVGGVIIAPFGLELQMGSHGWWFLANVLGMLTIAPLLLQLHGYRQSRQGRMGRTERRGAARFDPQFGIALVGCAVLALVAMQLRGLGLMPLMIAAMVYITTRYGQFAAHSVVLIYAGAATLLSMHGASPVQFADITRDSAAMALQVGLLAMLMTALPIAVLLASRNELAGELLSRNEALRRNNTELGLAEALAGIGRWRYDLRTGEQDWSPTMRALFALAEETIPENDQLLALLPENGAALKGTINAHGEDREPFNVECRVALPDGGERVLSISVVNEFDDAGTRIALFGVAMDITDRIRREEALDFARGRAMQLAAAAQKLANTDALTGLPNRRCTFSRLNRLILTSQITGKSLSAIIFDIDHFKRVNDRMGHQCGDQVLIDIAATAQRQVRSGDLVGRIGGEEFVWLLPDIPGPGAARLAERLRKAVETQSGEGGMPAVTVSIGVATLRPDENGESLLARADRALYRAKNAGRNKVSKAA